MTPTLYDMSLVATTADDVVNQVTTGNDIVITTNDVVVTTDDVVMTTDDVVMTTYDSSRPSHDLRNRLTTRLVQKSGFYSKLLSSRTSNQFVADIGSKRIFSVTGSNFRQYSLKEMTGGYGRLHTGFHQWGKPTLNSCPPCSRPTVSHRPVTEEYRCR